MKERNQNIKECCLNTKTVTYDKERMTKAVISLFEKHAPKSKVKFKPDLKRAYFKTFTNTAYAYDLRSLLSELTHAKQLQDMGFLKMAWFGIKSWFMNPYFNTRQQYDQYTHEGTLEYEAHNIIGKKMWEDFREAYMQV